MLQWERRSGTWFAQQAVQAWLVLSCWSNRGITWWMDQVIHSFFRVALECVTWTAWEIRYYLTAESGKNQVHSVTLCFSHLILSFRRYAIIIQKIWTTATYYGPYIPGVTANWEVWKAWRSKVGFWLLNKDPDLVTCLEGNQKGFPMISCFMLGSIWTWSQTHVDVHIWHVKKTLQWT